MNEIVEISRLKYVNNLSPIFYWALLRYKNVLEEAPELIVSNLFLLLMDLMFYNLALKLLSKTLETFSDLFHAFKYIESHLISSGI